MFAEQKSTSKRHRCSIKWRFSKEQNNNFCQDSHLKLQMIGVEWKWRINEQGKDRNTQLIKSYQMVNIISLWITQQKETLLSARKKQANRLAWSDVLELEPAFLARFTHNLGSLVQIMLHLLGSLFYLLLKTTHSSFLPSFLQRERERQTNLQKLLRERKTDN